jgi:ABC-type amino acid transport substrate-binding protein
MGCTDSAAKWLLVFVVVCISGHVNSAPGLTDVTAVKIHFPINSGGSAGERMMSFQNGDASGQLPDLVACSFERIGRKVVFFQAPFARIQRNISSREADGFFPANKAKNRNETSTASGPILDDYKVLVTSKYVNEKRARGPGIPLPSIGVLSGAERELNLAKKYGEPIMLNGYEQMLHMLAADRLDGFVASQLSLAIIIQDQQIDAYKLVDLEYKKLEDAPFHLFFGNFFLEKNPLILDEFNRALIECKH